MKSTLRLGAPLLLALCALSGAPACSTGSEPKAAAPVEKVGRVSQALDGGAGQPLALLNELKIAPGGTDTPWEYVEISCTPGEALTSLFFVEIDGDSANQGKANRVIDLNNQTCGTNGLFVIKSAAASFTPAAGTGVLEQTTFDTGTGALQNGATSLLLVRSDLIAIQEGTDYDVANAGPVGFTLPGSIVDAVGWQNGAGVGVVFGGVELKLPDADAGDPTIGAATRFPGDETALSGSAWYFGSILGTTPSDSVDYTGVRSDNFPVGGVLTPGAPNAPAPSGSTSAGGDAGDDAGNDAGDDAGGTSMGSTTAGGDAGDDDGGTDDGGSTSGSTTGDAGGTTGDAGGTTGDAGPRDGGGDGGGTGSTSGSTTGDGGARDGGADGGRDAGRDSGSTAGATAGSTAGTTASTTGSVTVEAGTTSGDTPASEEGCSCRTAGGPSSGLTGGPASLAFGAAALVLARRRRRAEDPR